MCPKLFGVDIIGGAPGPPGTPGTPGPPIGNPGGSLGRVKLTSRSWIAGRIEHRPRHTSY